MCVCVCVYGHCTLLRLLVWAPLYFYAIGVVVSDHCCCPRCCPALLSLRYTDNDLKRIHQLFAYFCNSHKKPPTWYHHPSAIKIYMWASVLCTYYTFSLGCVCVCTSIYLCTRNFVSIVTFTTSTPYRI